MSKSTETIRIFYATAARWDFESPYVEKFTNDFNEWLADYKKEVLDEAAERAQAVSGTYHDHDTYLGGKCCEFCIGAGRAVAAVRGDNVTEELSLMDEHRNNSKSFCHHCCRFVEPTHVCED